MNTMSHELVKNDIENAEHVTREQTTQSITMSMEMFEKLYLSPQTRSKGELREIFGNPTPLSVSQHKRPQAAR
jgi:uncharacterized protein